MSLTNDDRKWLTEQFEAVHTRVTNVQVHGCSKAAMHDETERRVRSLEVQQASTQAKMGVVALLFGALAGLFSGWFHR